MSTHTPGAWHAAGDYVFAMRNSGYTQPITRTYSTKNGSPGIQCLDCDPEEAQANARLIAAAPELLEACRKAKAFLDSCGLDWLGKGDDPLAAAIAKATGQPQSSSAEEVT